MTAKAAMPSARQVELTEAAYRYVLEHGIADLSLRPLAKEIGSSPRVLIFLFGSKEGLVTALLARARAHELELLEHAEPGKPLGLAGAVVNTWAWLAAPEHRALLRLWAEVYTRSLVDPDGPWGGFARQTVADWLIVLGEHRAPAEVAAPDADARLTLSLATMRGLLLDLLATGDDERTTAALQFHLEQGCHGRTRIEA